MEGLRENDPAKEIREWFEYKRKWEGLPWDGLSTNECGKGCLGLVCDKTN